jgi:hypothetical protein
MCGNCGRNDRCECDETDEELVALVIKNLNDEKFPRRDLTEVIRILWREIYDLKLKNNKLEKDHIELSWIKCPEGMGR